MCGETLYNIMVDVALGGFASLYGYNRKNFMFDGKMQQRREYQGQSMRIKQFELYREDIRELVDLTVSKMDNYLLINVILTGFCVKLFTEGRPRPGETPSWLHFLYGASIAGALMYFMLSVWLAMHASIASHSFGVRLLTQFLRLPVPTRAQMDAAQFRSTDFEGGRCRDMLRLPVLKQQLRKLNATMDDMTTNPEAQNEASDDPLNPPQTSTFSRVASFARSTSAASQTSMTEDAASAGPVAALTNDPVTESQAANEEHVQLYRRVQVNWQAYDAYARVCMSLGATQLLSGLCYFCLIMFVGENELAFPALTSCLIFVGASCLISRLDLYLAGATLRKMFIRTAVPPCAAWISMIVLKVSEAFVVRKCVDLLFVAIFALHVHWVYIAIDLAKADTHEGLALPTKFRSVLYLDVYGWIRSARQERPTHQNQATTAERVAGEPSRDVSGQAEEEMVSEKACRSLADLCRRLYFEISRELLLWQSPSVYALVSDRLEFNQRIMSCSLQFDGGVAKFADLLPAESRYAALLSGPVCEDREQQMWLKLGLQQGQRSIDYFFQPGTDKTCYSGPPPEDPVSDLDGLETRICNFCGRLGALSAVISSSSTSSRARNVNDSSAGTDQPRAAIPATDRNCRSNPEAHPSSTSGDEPASNPPGEFHHINPEVSAAVRNSVAFGCSAYAAGTFHPHADAAQPVNDSGNGQNMRNLPRPPGQMPWITVRQGSVALMFCWVLGCVWVCLEYVFELDISLSSVRDPSSKVSGVLMPEKVVSIVPPQALFNPKGLVCHPLLGPGQLFVPEAYTVHMLRPQVGNDAEWNALGPRGWDISFSNCLDKAQDFVDAGIRSMSIVCDQHRRRNANYCNAVFLGGHGEDVLRCGFKQRSNIEENSTFEHALSTAFGGPWRTLVTSEFGTWGVRQAGATLLAMQQGLASQSDFLPRMQLDAGEVVSNITQLLALQDGVGALFGLSVTGRMTAWSLKDGSQLSWQLPRHTRWVGACSAGGFLFFAGLEKSFDSLMFSIWRSAIPPELVAADAPIPRVKSAFD